MNEDPRYPIGEFIKRPFDESVRSQWTLDLRMLPQALELAVQNLDEHQLLTPYREGGWTVQQVVHHVADSHINGLVRFKLALTEVNPTIKPYDEGEWAKLADVRLPINISLTLLHALHARWVAVVESCTDEDLQRTFYHPERRESLTLWDQLGLYAWHGLHHTAHITRLRERMNW